MKIELMKFDKKPSCFAEKDYFEEYGLEGRMCELCPFSIACWLEYCEREEQYRFEHNIP
jgi:hypothetical protein